MKIDEEPFYWAEHYVTLCVEFLISAYEIHELHNITYFKEIVKQTYVT